MSEQDMERLKAAGDKLAEAAEEMGSKPQPMELLSLVEAVQEWRELREEIR